MNRKISQLVYSDLTGGINNVDTKERLNSSTRKTQTPEMMNVEYFGLGGIKSMDGNTQVGDRQSSSIVGGYEYTKGSDRYMMIATKDGSVKRYNNVTEKFDEIYKFANESNRVSFCNMNNGIIASNGIDDLIFYEYGRDRQLSGKIDLEKVIGVTPIQYSKDIVGTNTLFTVECKVGDYINIENSSLKYKIVEITDNTHMELDKNIILDPGSKYYCWRGLRSEISLESTGNVSCELDQYEYLQVVKSGSFRYYGNGVSRLLGKNIILNGVQYYFDDSTGRYSVLTDSNNGGYIYPGVYQTSDYDSYSNGYYIRDSKLYKESGDVLIDDSRVWTELIYSNENTEYTYGLCGTNLYCINDTTVTQISGTWTSVSGSSGTTTKIIGNTSWQCNVYGYGIKSGQLYYLNGATATRIGSLSSWQKVSGYLIKTRSSNEVFVCAVAYNNNGLNIIDGTANSNVHIIQNSSGFNLFNGYYPYHNYFGNGMFVSNGTKISRITHPQSGYTITDFKTLNGIIATDIIGYYNGVTSGVPIVLSDNGIYFCSINNNTYTIGYPYWKDNNGSEVNLSSYNIIANNAMNGDVISKTERKTSEQYFTRTVNQSQNLDVYSDASLSSELLNITNINISVGSLYFNGPTDTSSNPKIYRFYKGERYEDGDEINTSEQPSIEDGVSIGLSDISELNAYLNGDATKPIRGLAIQYYNGRLWVGGKDGLYFSAIGLPNNWNEESDAGYIGQVYNDSSDILALGLWSEFLMVHKEFSTYILSCEGNKETIEIKPFSNITCDSQQSWIVSNTKYFVFSKDFLDIYPLMQRTIFNDRFLGEPISENIRNTFKQIRIEDTDKIFCVSRPRERQMLFYLPMNNTHGSSTAVIFDFQTKSWLMRTVPQNVTIAFNYNNGVYIGTEDGYVLSEFTGSDFNGMPINAYYKTPWFDWTDGYMQSFAEFMIEIDAGHLNNFYIRTQKDGQSRYEDRIINSDVLSKKALTWSGDTEDMYNNTFWDDNQWAKGTFENIRMLLPNNVFEDFQIEIGTNQLGQAFSIYCYAFRRIEAEESPW